MRADEPDITEGDDLEAAIGFVGEVYAWAAMVGEDGSETVPVVKIDDDVVLWWTYFPSLAAPLT